MGIQSLGCIRFRSLGLPICRVKISSQFAGAPRAFGVVRELTPEHLVPDFSALTKEQQHAQQSTECRCRNGWRRGSENRSPARL